MRDNDTVSVRNRGLCSEPALIDPEWFFASPGSARQREARELCKACPMVVPCAEYALRTGIPYGVFGALDETERARYWRGRGGRPHLFDLEIGGNRRSSPCESPDRHRVGAAGHRRALAAARISRAARDPTGVPGPATFR